MVHCSLVKMTDQMVFIFLVKKITLVTLDMLNSTWPKWQRVLLARVQIGFLKTRISSLKTQEF
jgi:hypothetical protein